MGQKVDYVVNGHFLATPKITNIIHSDLKSKTYHVNKIDKNIQISYSTPTMTAKINETLYLTNTPASEQIGPS